MNRRYPIDPRYYWSQDGLVSIALEDIWWRLPPGMEGSPDCIIAEKFTWWVFRDNVWSYKVLQYGKADSFNGAFRAARYWIRQNQNLVYGGDYHEVS